MSSTVQNDGRQSNSPINTFANIDPGSVKKVILKNGTVVDKASSNNKVKNNHILMSNNHVKLKSQQKGTAGGAQTLNNGSKG